MKSTMNKAQRAYMVAKARVQEIESRQEEIRRAENPARRSIGAFDQAHNPKDKIGFRAADMIGIVCQTVPRNPDGPHPLPQVFGAL